MIMRTAHSELTHWRIPAMPYSKLLTCALQKAERCRKNASTATPQFQSQELRSFTSGMELTNLNLLMDFHAGLNFTSGVETFILSVTLHERELSFS